MLSVTIGLCTCRKISVISWRIVVNKHHGTLQVESEPGDTRFQVLLPLTAPADETPEESA